MPGLPATLAARRRVLRRFGEQLYSPSPSLPHSRRRDDLPHSPSTPAGEPLLDQGCHFIGPTIDSTIRDSDLDPELTEHLANPEPHVLISLGTLHAGSEDFFRTCFAALADIPARILISVGAHIDSARLGQIRRLLAALALAPVACATAAITWSSWRAAAGNTKPAPATIASAANGHRPDHLVPLQE